MSAASTTRPSATRFNGHKTDASGSKAIHAASVKLFQIENQKYKKQSSEFHSKILYLVGVINRDFNSAKMYLQKITGRVSDKNKFI